MEAAGALIRANKQIKEKRASAMAEVPEGGIATSEADEAVASTTPFTV